jgi:glycosyltransferase involved in cell wall biosynthesis
VTLKTYVDYFIKNKDIVYIFERLPCDDEIKKLKPNCIISAQFANYDVNKKIKQWNIPHVVLTFAPNQYTFNGEDSKYPSLVTYSNSYIKSNDPLQKNGYIVRDPVNHLIYEVKKENMKPIYITLIGSPPNIKGHNIFIELAKRFTTLKFMLVTHSKEYENIVLPYNIKLQDYIKDIDKLKKKVYSKIKVLLLPSIQEAYGRVVLEAIASNIPCILSDFPGLSEATYQMSNYVNDYKNIDKWEEELKRVLENYDDEVEKSNKLKLKLNFERDIKCFRDLVVESIKKHNDLNESNVSFKIIDDNNDDCKEVSVPTPNIK